MAAREFIMEFLERWGDSLDGAMIIARHKDGEVVDGWSREMGDDIARSLGMIEQFKLDFWDSVFEKRREVLDKT
jgi:hypothetical protein